MAKKIKRNCIVCGKEYTYCPVCEDDAAKPSWMLIFDSKDCHDIFDAVTKDMISNCKLEIDKYSDDITTVLTELTKKEIAKKTVNKTPAEGDKK